MSIKFSRDLIKGRITEVIFEQMMREEGNYTVIPFGYEHTVPTIAQYQDSTARDILDNIADTPDFVLISNDKRKIYLVEVKYQRKLNMDYLKKKAKKLSERWKKPWIFLATPEKFYCTLCKTILEGGINELSEKWVKKGRQKAYLELLNEFEK
ncbi:hypothetical protein KJ657_03425 [Patescibacteria group bacterium]|nr:hypothetical protein [Patescibacteria group bacterium]MBU1016115.1 hypothetical protein [Patescibacteria group bacterium]MBU1684858.1 hypothetical protein [Patescibacteria group bacterium]MBU1938574.1 hypothetical protein [Patescibacteria group bacterium]